MHIRYVVTHLNADGQRTMTCAHQFRNTHATPQQAQAWIDAAMRNNSESTLRSVTANNVGSLEIRPVECWAMRDGSIGDPKTVWFD